MLLECSFSTCKTGGLPTMTGSSFKTHTENESDEKGVSRFCSCLILVAFAHLRPPDDITADEPALPAPHIVTAIDVRIRAVRNHRADIHRAELLLPGCGEVDRHERDAVATTIGPDVVEEVGAGCHPQPWLEAVGIRRVVEGAGGGDGNVLILPCLA